MQPLPAPTPHEDAVQRRLAAVVPTDRFEAAWAAYESASMAGLCHEGAWEVALGVAAAAESPEADQSRSSSPHP